MMRRLTLTAATAALTLGATSLTAQEYETCMMSAVTVMLEAPEDATEAAQCEAACQADEQCVAWTFRPHSFDSEMPGTCRMMPDVYQTDASDSTFCGRIER